MRRSPIDVEKFGTHAEPGGSKMSGLLFAGTMPEPAQALIDAVFPYLAAGYDPQQPDRIAIVESTVEVTAEVIARTLQQHASGAGRSPISWDWFPRTSAAEHFAAEGQSRTSEAIASELGVVDGTVQCLVIIQKSHTFMTLSVDRLLELASTGLPDAPVRSEPDRKERNRTKAERRARAKGRG